MYRKMLIVLLIWGLMHPGFAQAGLFEDAQQAVNLNVGRADSTGISLRGGAGIHGFIPSGTTLLQGSVNAGGPCGAFSFATSMAQAIEEVPAMLEGLIQSLLNNMPMLVLCYISPTLCNLAEHWQALLNVLLQARYASCGQIQSVMAYSGMKLRGGELSRCLAEQAEAGVSISEALRTCNDAGGSILSPLGERRPNVSLIQEAMEAAGTTQEMRTLAQNLLGEIRLTTGSAGWGSQQARPQAALWSRYETHRQAFDTALQQAVTEQQTTGAVADQTMSSVSVPGLPLPKAAIDALAALQNDPTRSEALREKLTTSLAVTRLTWECSELQEQLRGSIDANQLLSDEERRLMEKRLEGLQAELKSLMMKKEVVEKHLQPAVDELLREYTRVQNSAAQVGVRAGSTLPPATPYRRQSPLGYSQ